MSENDRENLNFLLTVSEEGLQKWYDQADSDDLLYALELMHMCRIELDHLQLEDALQDSQFTEAKQILKKFT